MCANYKSGFTLAETIITLAIIGVVVVAAIPTITSKMLSNNSKLRAYCSQKVMQGGVEVQPHIGEAKCVKLRANFLFSECGTANASLCSVEPFVIGNANVPPAEFDAFPLGDSHYFPLTFSFNGAPTSIQNHFLSARNMIRIGDYFLREDGNNLILTRDIDVNRPRFPVATVANRNIIIGSITDNTSNFNTNTFEGNIILGNENNLLKCNVAAQNNIVYGTENNICSDGTHQMQNSIIYGQNNRVENSSSLVIGIDNKTKQNNSILIGNRAHDLDGNGNDDDDDALLDFSLAGVITSSVPTAGNARTIRLTAPLTITGEIFSGFIAHNSDIRLKNIKGHYNKGLNEILQVNTVKFYYNNDKSKTEHIGIIAQDIQKIFPEAVVKLPNGYYGVDDDPIFFAMVNALKEVNEKTQYEKQRHEHLANELAKLETELAKTNKGNNNFIFNIWNWLVDKIEIIGGLINA